MLVQTKKSLILAALLAFSPLLGFSASKAVNNTPANTKLDIVWVLDNSGSMLDYQQGLATKVEGFLYRLQSKGKRKVDVKMGLLSTDINDLPYVGFFPYDIIHNSNPHALEQFKAAITRLGTGGSGVEQAFDPVKLALLSHPFLREDSKLVVIVVSDEPEQSLPLHPVNPRGTASFISFLYSLRDFDSISTYGLLEMPERGCGNGDDYSRSRYDILIQATNGKAFPICDPFDISLSSIADHMTTRLGL